MGNAKEKVTWRATVPPRRDDLARRRHNAMARASIREAIATLTPGATVAIGGTAVGRDLKATIRTSEPIDLAALGPLVAAAYARHFGEFRGKRKRIHTTER